jgi:hypothetical protein
MEQILSVLVPINKVIVHVNKDKLSYKSVSPALIVASKYPNYVPFQFYCN